MAEATSPRARSPIDSWHRAHGARFAASGAWEVPAAYADVERELAAVRSGCGLVDLSAFAKWRVVGPAAPDVVEVLGAAAAAPTHGVAQLEGGLLACRLATDSLLLLDSSTDPSRIPTRLAVLPRGTAVIPTEATFALAGFCLAGPSAEQLLPRLTSLDLAALTAGMCAETAVAGVAALLVRADELTVPSWRICVARDLGEYLWERLLEAGHGFGLRAFGQETLAPLHRPGRT